MKLSDFFNKTKRIKNNLLTGKAIKEYQLNSSRVIDTTLARAIYHNTAENYKLSGGLVRPIINADVSFIGSPSFTCEDETLQEAMDSILKNNSNVPTQVHRLSLREGDFFIWAMWDEIVNEVAWYGLPVDKLDEEVRHPITDEVIQYVFSWGITYKDIVHKDKRANIKVVIDKELISFKYTKDLKSENKTVRNVLGFIPIVQFSNDRESFEYRGHSEITAIEPYLRAYHDVLLSTLQSHKNNATPRLKLKVHDMASFLDNNFGSGTYKKVKNGEHIDLSIENLDLLAIQEGDDASYLTFSSDNGSIALLQLLFYLIVETSEVIEVVFGAHLDSSRASTDNQLPVYSKKIERKQEQFSKSWEKLMEISLKIRGFASMQVYDNAMQIKWASPDFESAKEKIDKLLSFANACRELLNNGVISYRELHEKSKKYIDAIHPDYDEHMKDVKETAMLLAMFKEDSMSQGLGIEGDEYVD